LAQRLLLVMEEVKCGGAEISFFTLCSALSARCEVHLALSLASLEQPTIQRLSSSLSNTRVTLHACSAALNRGTLTNLHRGLRARPASELASLMRRVRPETILVNLPTVERGQAVVDAAALVTPRPPVWGFLHLTQPPSIIGAKLGRVRDLGVVPLLRRFDRLLVVSQAGAHELSERYHLEAAGIVYPPTHVLAPLSDQTERAKLRKAQGLPETRLVGLVGRIQIHHKGHDVALRTVRRLQDRGCPVHLVIIGDGPDRKALERLAEQLGIAPGISFLGWRNDVPQLVPLLDAVVMPSRYEGLPQVAIQAATAHVPIVGYAVGGLAELVPPEFTVRQGDEEGLAVALTTLLRNPASWPARQVAQRALSWCRPDHAADRVLALLNGSLQPLTPSSSSAGP
jgi:glycosyltransferase involved in cell wall biosynthesis